MNHIKTFENFINESVNKEAYLELIGPDVDELIDAINKLNGAQLSGKAFKYRDNVKLKPLDKTGHTISKDKFSIEVMPQEIKSAPDTSTYIKAANLFLEDNDYECRIYKK